MARAKSVRRLKLLEAEDALPRAARCAAAALPMPPSPITIASKEATQCRMPLSEFLSVLFFASGCAALIYETVWFHLVQLVVGASSLSVGVLLCSFMGGMALGSALLPRLVPASIHPLRVVAALEAGIAAFGILIPLALPYVQQAYVAMVGYGYAGRPASSDGVRRGADPADHADGRDVARDLAMVRSTDRSGVISRVPVHRQHCRRRRGHGARGVLPASGLRHGRGRRGGGGDQPRSSRSEPGGWPRDEPLPRLRSRHRVGATRSGQHHQCWTHHRRSCSSGADLCGRGDVGVHRAWCRGGVDAPAVAPLRRERLHVLVDPRCISRRPGRGQPGRIFDRATLEGSGCRSRAGAVAARLCHRLRCLDDRPWPAAVAANQVVSSVGAIVAAARRSRSTRYVARSP